jgi:cellulose synthase/poly-beta-1,6-N-acetylglucosamine synthase-like glycosyltransferase
MGGNCLYRGRALEQVGGFPAGSFGEDTEVSLALVAGGWQSRFVRGAVAGSALAESLRHYWQQRARWNWGLWKAGRHATGLESWMVVLGYADRLLILAAALLVAAGEMNVLWPALYLSAPCLASVVALWRAGIRRRIPGYLFSPVLLFAVDVAVTLASTLAVVFRRRPKWGGKA